MRRSRLFRVACLLVCMAVAGFSYSTLSLKMFVAIWGVTLYPDVTEVLWFNALTEPMDGRRLEAYNRAVRGAWREGMVTPWVTVRQTNSVYGFSYHGWLTTGGAAYWPPRKVLYAHTPWVDLLTDDEQVCVFAHELGHAMQDRRGELESRFWCGENRRRLEADADETAARICGRAVWDRLYRTRLSMYRSIPECF